jgi:hypothetical protein
MSDNLNIQVPKGSKLAVIGDVHEHPEQFHKMIQKIDPSWKMWFVSIGDIYDKGFGVKCAEDLTKEIQELQKQKIGFAVRGNHELKQIRKNKKFLDPHLAWWKAQPLALSFTFYTGSRVTVVHAGVTPGMMWQDLVHDVEVCYVRDVDDSGQMIPLVWKDIDGVNTLVKGKEGGDIWHRKYDGRFGYIVSGHAAQKDGKAKFYNYSCNLDSGVYDTGILTAQIFGDDGNREEVICVEGVARKPKLNIAY